MQDGAAWCAQWGGVGVHASADALVAARQRAVRCCRQVMSLRPLHPLVYQLDGHGGALCLVGAQAVAQGKQPSLHAQGCAATHLIAAQVPHAVDLAVRLLQGQHVQLAIREQGACGQRVRELLLFFPTRCFPRLSG